MWYLTLSTHRLRGANLSLISQPSEERTWHPIYSPEKLLLLSQVPAVWFYKNTISSWTMRFWTTIRVLSYLFDPNFYMLRQYESQTWLAWKRKWQPSTISLVLVCIGDSSCQLLCKIVQYTICRPDILLDSHLMLQANGFLEWSRLYK